MTKTKARPLTVGEVLVLTLPELSPPGHEQQGRRPVIVVAIPERPRYPMLVVAPLTSATGTWVEDNYLYPVLEAGQGNLPARSVVLLDHLRGLDASRTYRRLGSLTAAEYEQVQVGLDTLFGSEPGGV